MYDEELYEIARNKIDKHNRQMFYLGVNIFAMLVYMGLFAALSSVIPRGVGAFIAIVWIAIVVFHAGALSVVQNRNAEIEKEVERLRQQVYNDKPKRDTSHVELTDDGELVAFDDLPPRNAKRKDSL